MIHPVILCGGAGTRLWPSSRKAYPKQFVPLLSDESLYQSTLRRFSGVNFSVPLILSCDEYRFMAMEQAAAIGLTDARFVVEPVPRDTAASILIAALMLMDDPEALLLIAPSDHVIQDAGAFLEAVDAGAKAAASGALIAFGVPPERAETGYGYLELLSRPKLGFTAHLKSFCEKPNSETAEKMVAAENYMWNAGIFLARVTDIVDAFKKHVPKMLDLCEAAISNGLPDLGFLRLDKAFYSQLQTISFDYAVMERATDVMVVPLVAGWSDLGSWDAIWRASKPDSNGVSTFGNVTTIDCHDSYLRSEDASVELVGLGLDGVVAVAMRDAVLVADKSRAQDVKMAVEVLRTAGVVQADSYPRFHRPWGWYETLSLGPRFQVKRIMVNPGGVLSLQSHVHRSEHWVVVQGTAEVTINDEAKIITENESVYVPLGAVHRLANPGRVPMYLIEIQTGSYLGEDDIKRYEDIYNRP